MKANLLKTNLLIIALLVVSSGLMAQNHIWKMDGPNAGVGAWETPENWTNGMPGSAAAGRAIFRGGVATIETVVNGDYKLELGDNRAKVMNELTIKSGGHVGANRDSWSAVGIHTPSKLVVEQGGSLSTPNHFWVGLNNYTVTVDGVNVQNDEAVASEVHINGGTITVGKMFGIDFYQRQQVAGGVLYMNGGLLDLAEWNPGNPDDLTAHSSLGVKGKIVYTAGLIKIKGNHKASLERFKDGDQITGDFQIWYEQEVKMVDGVPQISYFTKLEKDGLSPLKDATLSNLTLSAGTLNVDFNANTYNYTVELAAGTAVRPTVTPTTTNANATAVVTENADASTTITITAEDGVTKNIYTVVFTGLVSVPDLHLDKFSIYPNPASSELFISHNVKIDRIEIYNVTGSRVMSQSNISTESIDISDLNSGLYFIGITDVNNNHFVKKFVKQ
jgi:hypothetical protein